MASARKKTGGNPALVIVESPAKAKTINKYLGSDYIVKASKGHVRDLPPRRYGIDPGRNFEPVYEILHSHRDIVADLKKHSAGAPLVYLATDLDREGEAIAWHLAAALELSPDKIRRVVFNEITKSAIHAAFEHPGSIDEDKVMAQQARRILDRVVGYELSPLLWKKVAKGLSAGRVQSVAVRLIVEREAAIRAFQPQEYWVIDAAFTPDPDRRSELAEAWRLLVASDGNSDEAVTQKARFEWLAKHGCLQATLVEVGGSPFKPEGGIVQGENGLGFASAVDSAKSVAESLGMSVTEVASEAWDAYEHFGVKRLTLVGGLNVDDAPAFSVKSVDTKRTTSKPPPPFTTATLQQAAATQLRFSASKTMRVAQGLYEGVDIKTGEGNVGLITYMRTDSTNLSNDSITAVRSHINAAYGASYLPNKPQRYASGKKAQEAHEAIRPTDVTRTPEALRGHLTPEQHKLYSLVWKRFVACQMAPAQWDATTILISAQTKIGEAIFRAGGRVLVFDGFYRVTGVPANGGEQVLPSLESGAPLAPLALEPQQKFTSPPPRFTEASLVKTLEAEAIGRPSTYAAIIKTIQDRGYAEQVDRRFHPTSRGEVVTEKLVAHFPKVLDVGFTRHVEDQLDKIEEKHLDWHDVLHEFYDPFKEALAMAHESMDAVRAEKSEYKCDKCGKDMVYRQGRNGRFLACTGYPDCTAAFDVDRDGKLIRPAEVSVTCDACGKPMQMRRSRRGVFLGCTGYPECGTTMPCAEDGTPLKKVKPEDIKESCPECGTPMQVKWARGRAFLGCTAYPKCKATKPLPDDIHVEKPPAEEAGARCDKCGRPMVIRKSRRGPFLSCSGFPKCRNAMPMDKLEHLQSLEKEGKIPEPPPKNGNGGTQTNGRNGKTASRGKAMSKEEIAALGPPPPGFAWTRTGRPVVEVWPKEPLTCFECGAKMEVRNGRFGPFVGCPSCRAAANFRGEAKKQAEAELPKEAKPEPIETDLKCPECGEKMLLRMGRTGRFLGCSGYPKCKKTLEVPPGLLRELAGSAS